MKSHEHHRACFDRIGERQEIAGAAKPKWHRPVRQRDAEIHVMKPNTGFEGLGLLLRGIVRDEYRPGLVPASQHPIEA